MSRPDDRLQAVIDAAQSRAELADELRKMSSRRKGLTTLELRRAVAALEAKGELLEPLRVVLLSTYTLDLMRDAWRFQALVHGFDLDLVLGDYGQVEQAFLTGKLFEEPADFTFVLLLPRDVCRAPADGAPARRVSSAVLELARMAAGVSTGRLVISNLPFDPTADRAPSRAAIESVGTMRVTQAEPGLLGVEVDSGQRLFNPFEDKFDTRLWEVSGFPLSPMGAQRVAAHLFRYVWIERRPPIKCIVLDADNTLWGGVVGEVGLEGIQLGDESPGSEWRKFQEQLLEIRSRGVLLALCSKNEEADVLAVLDEHPAGVLERKHFSAMRINWRDKAENIVEIADELNIGLDSILFVDDSDFECRRVRQALPDVRVSRVASADGELRPSLRHLEELKEPPRSEEDRRRPEMLRHEQERRAAREQLPSLEDYLQSLEMKLTLQIEHESQVPRLAQLCQRTNQFNLTTRRHDEAAIRRFLADPDALVASCALSDRFGSSGVVGLLIVTGLTGERYEVDTCLFSCRALGRRAEEVFVHRVLADLVARDPKPVVAFHLPTKKNARAAGFWPGLGFAERGAGRFEIEAEGLSGAHPAAVHFRVVEDGE